MMCQVPVADDAYFFRFIRRGEGLKTWVHQQSLYSEDVRLLSKAIFRRCVPAR